MPTFLLVRCNIRANHQPLNSQLIAALDIISKCNIASNLKSQVLMQHTWNAGEKIGLLYCCLNCDTNESDDDALHDDGYEYAANHDAFTDKRQQVNYFLL